MYPHTNAVYGHMQDIPMKSVIVSNMKGTPGGHCGGELFMNTIPGYTIYSGEKISQEFSPIDLSPFNNGNIRDSDSPLDLSVKTRKRHADSTDQFDCLGQPRIKRSHFLSQPLDLRAKDSTLPRTDRSTIKTKTGFIGKELSRSHAEKSFQCSSYDTRTFEGRNSGFINNQQHAPGNISKFHPTKEKKTMQPGLDQTKEFLQMIRGMTNVGSSLPNANHRAVSKNNHAIGVSQGSVPNPQLSIHSQYASSKSSLPGSFFDMGNTNGVLRCSPDSTTMKQSKYVRASVQDSYLHGYNAVKQNTSERYIDFNNLSEWFTDRPHSLVQNHSVSHPSLGAVACQSNKDERTFSNPDNQIPGSTIHYKSIEQVCRDRFSQKHVAGANKLQSPDHNFMNTLRQTQPSQTNSKHAYANFVSLNSNNNINNIQRLNNSQSNRSITKGTSGLVQSMKYNCTTAESRPKPTKSDFFGDRYVPATCSMQIPIPSNCVLQEPKPLNYDNSLVSSHNSEPVKYETPLSISIPPAQLDRRPQTNELIRKPPKLAFKKHIILGSVRKDENTRTTAQTEMAKICDSNSQVFNCGSSTSFARSQGSVSPNPSSPKMPTLSPQYKLPPPLISPLTVEPPKLDLLETECGNMSKGPTLMPNQNPMNPVAKIRPGLKSTIHSDDSDTNSCSSLFSKDCNSKTHHCDQNDISRLSKTNCPSVFSKDKTKCSFLTKQSGCSRNIPVANVAPMVHKKLETATEKPSEDIVSKTDDKMSNICSDDLNGVRKSVIQNGQLAVHIEPEPQVICDNSSENEMKPDKMSDVKSEILSNVSESPVKLSPLMKKILRQRQLSQEHSIPGRSIEDGKQYSISREIYHSDHLTSLEESVHSSCDRIMKSRNHRRSLLDEIANSTGYVGESKRLKAQTNDLLSDPSLLSREDRALRRAIMQFEKMENKPEKSKSPRNKPIITNTKRKADQLRKKARLREDKTKIESRKRMMKKRLKSRRERQKGFVDFKPRILKSRTRMQAAGKRGLAKYDRNAAYDKELTREETRNELRKRARLEQHQPRSSTRSRSRSISVPAAPEVKEEAPPVHEGSWQIQGVSHTSKQTLRSGRSKGGLMLKLSWQPNQNKFSRRAACRRESSRNINIKKDSLRYATLNCPYKKRGGESYSFVRNAGHYLRQNIRKLRAKNKAKNVDVNLDKGTKCDYSIMTRSRDQSAKKPSNSMAPKMKRVKKTKRRFRRSVKMETTEPFQKTINQESIIPLCEPWASTDLPPSHAAHLKQDLKKIPVDKKTGETLLHRAGRLGYEDLVVKCLESGDQGVNVRDNAGFTPLHESCAHGHLDVAQQLISYGADINLASLEGIRPIHDAVENNHIEIVRLLLSHGADPNISYAGKTLVKMAKTDVTKRFLQGHIDDLNGSAEESSPWDFYGSSNLMDPSGGFGCDLFEDVPSDPEDDTDDIFNDTDTSPTFLTFDLVLEGKSLAEECILLSDILQYLQVSKVYFDRKLNGCDLVHSTKKEDLLVSIPEDLCSLSYISIGQSVVHVVRRQDLHNILLTFKNQSNKVARRSEKQKACSRKKRDMVESKEQDLLENTSLLKTAHSDQTKVDYINKKDPTNFDFLNKWNDLSESQGSLDFTLKEGTVPEDCFSSIFLKNQSDQNEQGQLPCESFQTLPDKSLDMNSPVMYTSWS